MKNRNGFTLVELCYVMAIVAIISAMVVSFMIWSSKNSQNSVNAGNTVSDLISFKNQMDSWLSTFDKSDLIISVDSDKSISVKDENGATVAKIQYSNGEITAENSSFDFKPNTFKNVSFSQIKDDGNTVLIKCEVLYDDSETKTDLIQEFFFSVHSGIVRERYVSPSRN